MVLYVLVFICLAILVLFIGGVSFAIAGRGHRKAWTPIVLLEVIIWGVAARAMLAFADGAEQKLTTLWNLAEIFWMLSLPSILWVSAWFFKRYREGVL